MPLSNTTQDILRSHPYWDDYDRDKRFHRVLIKPRTPIQTRELNQVQSILQNQVEQLTSSVYREGAAVSGGQETLSTAVSLLQVIPSDTVDINNFFNPETNVGAVIEGQTSGARAIVTQVKLRVSPTLPYSGILFAPLTAATFEAGEVVVFTDISTGEIIASLNVAPGSESDEDVPTEHDPIINASTFSIDSGVFYLRGHLVDVPKQTVILSTSSNAPSNRIGFVVVERIVTSAEDATLLDPALGTTNYAGPGADRLKLSAILTAKEFGDDSSIRNDDDSESCECPADGSGVGGGVDISKASNFIEIVQVIDGVIQPRPDRLESNFIENTLARRTNDESGDYVVKPFRLLVKDHNPPVNIPNITGRVSTNADSVVVQSSGFVTNEVIEENGTITKITTLFDTEIGVGDVLIVNGERRTVDSISSNTALTVNAAFTQPFTNATATVITEDKVNLELEPGKAYVRGFEIETTGVTKLAAPRARTTTEFNNQAVSTGFGPYVIVTQDSGLYDINRIAKTDLHCVAYEDISTNQTTYASSKIGTARVRSFTYHSGNGDANTTYKMYLVGAEFQSKRYDVSADGSASDIKLKTVAINVEDRTVSLEHQRVSLPSHILPIGNNAFNGTTIKLKTIQGRDISYSVVSSTYDTDGTTVTQHLKLNADDSLRQINTTATVQVIFNDKAIRGMSANSLKTIGSTVNSEGKIGGSVAGNTVFFGTNSTSMLFRYRGGIVKPDTIENETYDAVRYISSLSGVESGTNFKFVINPVNFQIPMETSTATESIVACKVDGTRISLKNAILSSGDDSRIIELTIPKTDVDNTGATTVNIQVYARMQVSAIGDTLLTPRTKTLLIGNTNVSSITSSSGDLVSDLTKGHIAINDISTTSSRVVSLGIADVHEIKKVYAIRDVGAIMTSYTDVTSHYELDNGQRDWCYDFSSLVLKSGFNHPSSNPLRLLVVVDRWEHSASSSGIGYFAPSSYSGIDIEDMPAFANPKTGKVIQLSNHVDFRPVRTANVASANTANDPYVSSNAQFDLMILPHPNASYRADYEVYLSRIDKLVLTKNREFKLISGTPSSNPVVPPDDAEGITLYIVSFPAYTPFPTTVQVRPLEYKRYAMRDIRALEKRIENLEYYAALSIMDLQSLNNPELDENDTERFKNGIVTDNFSNDATINQKHPDTTVSLDHLNKQMRPRGIAESIRLTPMNGQETDLIYARQLGLPSSPSGLISLDYNEVPLITQGLASKSVNINPFNVFSWVGTMQLFPSSDTWIDTITKPDVVVNLFNENDGIVDGESVSTSWNYWQTIHSGVISSEQIFYQGYLLTEDPTSPHPEDQWETNGVRLQNLTATQEVTLDTTTTYGSATDTHTKISTISTDLGEKIVDTSIATKMRGTDIDVAARGLLPGAVLNATFDEIDVTNYIERANVIEISENLGIFSVGDTIQTSGSVPATARIVAIVENPNSTYLYVTGTTGVFTSATIVSRTNPNNFINIQPPGGIGVLSYQHWHGVARGISGFVQDGRLELQLDLGANAITGDNYIGKVINFTDGGYTEYLNLAATGTGATQIFGSAVAGLKARIVDYNPATQTAVLAGWSPEFASALSAQLVRYTTEAPIRYSIGLLETTNVQRSSESSLTSSPGTFFGMFRLPGLRQPVSVPAGINRANFRYRSSKLQFNTGQRVFRLIKVDSSEPQTNARTEFVAQGSTVVKQKDIVRTRQIDTWNTVGEAQVVSTTDSTSTQIKNEQFVSWVDPLAQTFLISAQDYPHGIFITSVDLFFAKKGTSGMDVTVQLRPTVGDQRPSPDQVLASAQVSAKKIRVVPVGVTPNAADPTHRTRFYFDTPQYLAPNAVYALVVMSNSNEYEVFVGELGKSLIGSNQIISQQPHGGVFFKSQNGGTWTDEQNEDLMFAIHRADFSMKEASVVWDTASDYITLPFGTIDGDPYNFTHDLKYDLLNLNMDYLTFPVTNVQFSLSTLTNKDNVMLTQPIVPGMNTLLPERMLLLDKSSLLVETRFRTANSHVSPVFDTSRASTVLVRHIIDNGQLYANAVVFTPGTPSVSGISSSDTLQLTVSGGNGTGADLKALTNSSGYITEIVVVNGGYGYTETPTITLEEGAFSVAPTFTYRGETSKRASSIGEHRARYLTRTINLADGFDSGDLKVYLSATRGPQHNIDVYYRVLATGDPEIFDDKPWVLMQLDPAQQQVYSSSPKNRKDYTYRTVGNTASYVSNGVTFDRFHTFAIKVVLRSGQLNNPFESDTISVPVISNLRVIALDE